MKNMGHRDHEKYFNFVFFYAYFFVFCYEFRELAMPYVKAMSKKERTLYERYKISLLSMRIKYFIKNIIRTRLRDKNYSWNDVKNSWEAEKIIDKKISGISPIKMVSAIKAIQE